MAEELLRRRRRIIEHLSLLISFERKQLETIKLIIPEVESLGLSPEAFKSIAETKREEMEAKKRLRDELKFSWRMYGLWRLGR